MLERFPYFRFYSSEYLLDTLDLLTTEQHGAYLLLILHYYWNRGLPEKMAATYALCHANTENSKAAVDFALERFFHLVDGHYRHNRIERELAALDGRVHQASEAGKRSAAARAGRRKPRASPANGTFDMSGFARFWEKYPRKEGKVAAEKSWHAIKPDAALVAAIMGAVENQKASAPWQRDKGKFIPHASTWLNGKRWQDEAPPERDPDALVI